MLRKSAVRHKDTNILLMLNKDRLKHVKDGEVLQLQAPSGNKAALNQHPSLLSARRWSSREWAAGCEDKSQSTKLQHFSQTWEKNSVHLVNVQHVVVLRKVGRIIVHIFYQNLDWLIHLERRSEVKVLEDFYGSSLVQNLCLNGFTHRSGARFAALHPSHQSSTGQWLKITVNKIPCGYILW